MDRLVRDSRFQEFGVLGVPERCWTQAGGRFTKTQLVLVCRSRECRFMILAIRFTRARSSRLENTLRICRMYMYSKYDSGGDDGGTAREDYRREITRMLKRRRLLSLP